MFKTASMACSILLLVAACGSEPTPPPSDAAPSRAEELTYGCGGRATFTAAAVRAGRAPSDDVLAALAQLRQTMDGAMLPADGWFAVSHAGRRSDLLAPAGEQYASASFEKKDGEWKPAGWGDCLPRLELADESVLEWEFSESSYPPDGDATEIDVLAGDTQCTSGRNLEGLVESDVTYTETTLEVVLTAPPPEAGKSKDFTCEGTGPVPYTLQLDEPIGDREVVDVSVYPPREPAPGTARGF